MAEKQKYLKLLESHKSKEENIEHLGHEINEKDQLISKLENEVLHHEINKQDLQTTITKLTLNLHSETIQSLNAAMTEYDHQDINDHVHENKNEQPIPMNLDV